MKFSFESKFLGKSFLHLPVCQSTNDLMLEYATNPDNIEGHLILADEQTHGRGQRGNVWEAEKNQNLTFTLLLKPNIKLINQYNITILCAVALREALQSFTEQQVLIKWPNDIYVFTSENKWKKIAGMLIENKISQSNIVNSIVGIGVNINQTNFSNTPLATSLKLCNATETDKWKVLNKILLTLEKYYNYDETDYNLLRYIYTQNLLFYGVSHKYEASDEIFDGILLGIDDLGRMVLQKGDSITKYDIKEIKYLF
ncbi:MAG: biotin--[acetyl-CoA-carboxylase] ligase [Cytophagales bacterium]